MIESTSSDDWPLPYRYQGRNPWVRILRSTESDPVRHKHSCPECFDTFVCLHRCTLEPDLEDPDGTPRGSAYECPRCWPRPPLMIQETRPVCEEQLSLFARGWA